MLCSKGEKQLPHCGNCLWRFARSAKRHAQTARHEFFAEQKMSPNNSLQGEVLYSASTQKTSIQNL
jgi:hypothetical protein